MAMKVAHPPVQYFSAGVVSQGGFLRSEGRQSLDGGSLAVEFEPDDAGLAIFRKGKLFLIF